MTNYDRIKSMSVDEMAMFLVKCDGDMQGTTKKEKQDEARDIQQWLLQEVDVMYRLTQVQKKVILAFAENNMNVSKTARAMNYHRNTMVYHLAKIYDDCQLNPYYFYDLVELVNMSKGGDK